MVCAADMYSIQMCLNFCLASTGTQWRQNSSDDSSKQWQWEGRTGGKQDFLIGRNALKIQFSISLLVTMQCRYNILNESIWCMFMSPFWCPQLCPLRAVWYNMLRGSHAAGNIWDITEIFTVYVNLSNVFSGNIVLMYRLEDMIIKNSINRTRRWQATNLSQSALYPLELLNWINEWKLKTMFPNICIMLRIFCTLPVPVMVAQAEQSFTAAYVLAGTKNVFHFTKCQNRQSNLWTLLP